jgi:hypothetical protein
VFDIESAGQPVWGRCSGWRSKGKCDIKNKQISDRATALLIMSDYDKLSKEEREARDKADRAREADEQSGMLCILL